MVVMTTPKKAVAKMTAADPVELLELPKPLLDAIAHTHPHVRDVVDDLYLQRANSPEVAAARSISGVGRPRASSTVRTYGDLVVVVQGGAEDVVADRIDTMLLAKGAACSSVSSPWR